VIDFLGRQYLEIVSRYLPLRENLIKFLKALRDWPRMMDLRAIKSSDFTAKVPVFNFF
jgi:hypothetical protein